MMMISTIKSLKYSLILLLLPLVVFSQNDLTNDVYCNKASAARYLIGLEKYSNPLTENYDLKYYRFDWQIDPAVYGIKGSATPYFQVLSDGFAEINFDFSNQLTIDSIIYHDSKVTFSQPQEYLLTVQLPKVLATESIDSVSIFYHGAPPSGGFGSFIQSTHAGAPALWTLSEPFGAQDWWPCKNGLTDKIDSVDVFVTTQNEYRAASNGILASEINVGNGLKQFHWKHRYPIAPYLVAISVTNYVTYVDEVHLSDGKVMPMLNYVYPESIDNAKIGTANNVRVLEYFDSLFVPYPFKNEKNGHAQFGWGGGMEHQTMSFVVNFDWGLLAHELAHQWFGDMVTCGDWTDIWLNEGFATYLEGLSREHFQAPNVWYDWKLNKINSITSRTNGSVLVSDPTSVDRIFSSRLSYNKGSYLLHMLRWKLGDENFFAGLRNYLNDKAYQYARTTELKSHLESISGEDLTEFFEDWFSGEGFPTYTVTWDQEPDKLLIKLDQIASDPSVNFFEMPVPVRLTGNGQETTVRLEHNESGQIFVLNPGFTVENVEFDPELWLLAKSSVVKGNIVLGTKDLNITPINVFPNPATSEISVDLLLVKNFEMTYSLFDPSGKLLKNGPLNTKQQKIDVNKLAPASYRMIIYSAGKPLYNASFSKI